MDYTSIIYEIEDKYLSGYAAKSINTRGRKKALEPCPLRTEYQRDRDRILHCKAFRRLKHKTQVFLSPEGDHYRTRLTHTLEVSQIARTISRALRLNEELTEAIALGHDLGHTPFGHAGERALQDLYAPFEHNLQSGRVVEVLEYDFKGLNLTYEVIDGIINHKINGTPATLEGKVVSFADRIAYINHDIDDAIRGGIMVEEDIPPEIIAAVGRRHGIRINNLIKDIVENSFNKPEIKMSPVMFAAMNSLRDFMFKHVYTDSVAKAEEGKAQALIKSLFNYYISDITRLPADYQKINDPDEVKVCDFIATMTDRYAIATFENLVIPKNWKKY